MKLRNKIKLAREFLILKKMNFNLKANQAPKKMKELIINIGIKLQKTNHTSNNFIKTNKGKNTTITEEITEEIIQITEHITKIRSHKVLQDPIITIRAALHSEEDLKAKDTIANLREEDRIKTSEDIRRDRTTTNSMKMNKPTMKREINRHNLRRQHQLLLNQQEEWLLIP